jgi:hypothetical protein
MIPIRFWQRTDDVRRCPVVVTGNTGECTGTSSSIFDNHKSLFYQSIIQFLLIIMLLSLLQFQHSSPPWSPPTFSNPCCLWCVDRHSIKSPTELSPKASSTFWEDHLNFGTWFIPFVLFGSASEVRIPDTWQLCVSIWLPVADTNVQPHFSCQFNVTAFTEWILCFACTFLSLI